MLVMAHWLSTILSADRVIMLDQEQVVVSGRHADLSAVVCAVVVWYTGEVKMPAVASREVE